MCHLVKTLAMKTSPSLPSPRKIHIYLHLPCASWRKVTPRYAMRSEEESDSDDELDPNAFTNLIHEYTSMIKKEKKLNSRLLRKFMLG